MKIRILIPFLICVAACGNSDQGSTDFENKVSNAITDQTASLANSWIDLDAELYLSHFSEDFVFYIQGSRVNRGEFDDVVRASISSLQESTFDISDQEIEVLGQNAGVTSFKLQEVMTDTSGQVTDLKAVFTLVFERRKSNWKIVRAHESFSME